MKANQEKLSSIQRALGLDEHQRAVIERLIEQEKEDSFKEGKIEGLTDYAWWKDGTQYVGTCGTKLKTAIKEIIQSNKLI